MTAIDDSSSPSAADALGRRPSSAQRAVSIAASPSGRCVLLAQCGQRAMPPYPTCASSVVDAFAELSGWDGRFAETVRALLRASGQCSRVEFLEGRRARYLSPLRLYLTCEPHLLRSGAPRRRRNAASSCSSVEPPADRSAAIHRGRSASQAVAGHRRSNADPDPERREREDGAALGSPSGAAD